MKICKDCGINPACSARAHRCEACRKAKRATVQHAWKVKNGLIAAPGVGSGGVTKSGAGNPAYKHGGFTHESKRQQLKADRRYCEDCGKDLLHATHYEWVLHHIDHNHYNNPDDGSNWSLLCKRCHQVEHECWKAFEGSTTIPEGSTSEEDADGNA